MAPDTHRNAGPAPDFALPVLVFDNRTPHAAAQFDTVDQFGTGFHVFVVRIGYAIGARDAARWAALAERDIRADLNTADRHIDDDPAAGVLEESDFAPYKPRCDVIVNGTAWAPRGMPRPAFPVRLALAPSTGGKPLIDKILTVTGALQYRRKNAALRVLQWPLHMASFGKLFAPPWTLTAAAPLTQLPLRYGFAHGGECRIDDGDPAAQRVDAAYRLPAAMPATMGGAIAHDACYSNPLGRGFARRWYLDATHIDALPAAQITYRTQPCSAEQFWQVSAGAALPQPAGFGVVGRAWLPRRALIGEIAEPKRWDPDQVPRLPASFDYAYWNCAPVDQQCNYPAGGEQLALTNLCRPDHPAAWQDDVGNTMLRLTLPVQALFVLAVDHEQKLTAMSLSLDTIYLAPDSGRLDLVWRGCLPVDEGNVMARLMHVKEQAQIDRLHLLERLQQPDAQAAPAASAAPSAPAALSASAALAAPAAR